MTQRRTENRGLDSGVEIAVKKFPFSFHFISKENKLQKINRKTKTKKIKTWH